MSEHLFTSESVTEGHPDKLADQISDAVLDAVLTDDPRGRVACETYLKTGLVLVGGEITTETYVDVPAVARGVVRDAGYVDAAYGFDAASCAVLTAIDEQAAEIAAGVDESYEARVEGDGDPLDREGAGDQGMMFGYATNETSELMPLPIMAAHGLASRLAEVRKSGTLPWLRPDGKTQVTVLYEEKSHGRLRPVKIVNVLVSTQHHPNTGINVIEDGVWEHVVKPVLSEHYQGLYDENSLRDSGLRVNPSGSFELGGPQADAGLTGRKIIVDTYGGAARHGGGAFSGKDPSKVDRSGAYAARYVAKNIVAAGLAQRCEVQVAYAIGSAYPVSISLNTFGSEKIDLTDLQRLVEGHFNLRPAAIIRDLDLLRPIYRRTATYGHFGRDDASGGFTWERTDKAEELREAAKAYKPAGSIPDYVEKIDQQDAYSPCFLSAAGITGEAAKLLQPGMGITRESEILRKHKDAILKDMLATLPPSGSPRGLVKVRLLSDWLREAIECDLEGKQAAAMSLLAVAYALFIEDILLYANRDWDSTDPRLSHEEKAQRREKYEQTVSKAQSKLGDSRRILYDRCRELEAKQPLTEQSAYSLLLYRFTLSVIKHVTPASMRSSWDFNRHEIFHYPYEASRSINHYELIRGYIVLCAWLA